MGGPLGRCVPFPEVGGRGPAVGQEEEQQQHDLREAQPGHEVNTAHNPPLLIPATLSLNHTNRT